MEKIQEYGFRVSPSKCSLLQAQINYVARICYPADGRRSDPAKSDTITRMPKVVTQHRSFLSGKLEDIYETFVRNMHNIHAPLDALTTADATFTKAPACLSNLLRLRQDYLEEGFVLGNFDTSLPVVIATDA